MVIAQFLTVKVYEQEFWGKTGILVVRCRSHARCVFVGVVTCAAFSVFLPYRRYNPAFLKDQLFLFRVEVQFVVVADQLHLRHPVILSDHLASSLCLAGGR